MMNCRQLMNEIPAGRFHSVLMTSYSLNLYYWDLQLTRILAAKGVGYVAALVDSGCLSEQLANFSRAFSGNRALEFCLHGYKMKGAFHPKIQFYVGCSCVLVLVGSGNLTTSGHGGNLEVWTPVMVESAGQAAYPFVREVWAYLKGLYAGLGDEAERIVASMEANSVLLQGKYQYAGSEFDLGECAIRFFANGETSIFSQCVDWIGHERIHTITIMSPFYDRQARLVEALCRQFKPRTVNVIIEQGFGALPKASSWPAGVNVYQWNEVGRAEGASSYDVFHAKCFFFEGEAHHFMLCGSANASVAAFGLPGVRPANEEASVGFKSAVIDYFRLTGFQLKEPVRPADIGDERAAEDEGLVVPALCWIKEASCLYKSYRVAIANEGSDVEATMTFYTGARKMLYSRKVIVKAGHNDVDGMFKEPLVPLYVELADERGALVSIRQFVISVEKMDANNPSPASCDARKRGRDIEAGKFVSGEVMRFIEQILGDTDRRLSARPGRKTQRQNGQAVESAGHSFASFDDYMRDDGHGMTGGRNGRVAESVNTSTSMLFDSIVAYVEKSNKEMADDHFDDDEALANEAYEGEEKRKRPCGRVHSEASAEKIHVRVIKMFDKYIEYLESAALSDKSAKARVYLSKAIERFTVAVFFLYRTFSYRFALEAGADETHALKEMSIVLTICICIRKGNCIR